MAHTRIWALVAQAIGQLRWFLRPRGTVRVWPASHGLRYTTFFGGDGRHAVGFFNPWLACPSRLVLDRMVACSTYVREADCARLPIQSPMTAASGRWPLRGKPPCRVTRGTARGWFQGPIWQTNEFRSSFSGPIGRQTSFGVVEMLFRVPYSPFLEEYEASKGHSSPIPLSKQQNSAPCNLR